MEKHVLSLADAMRVKIDMPKRTPRPPFDANSMADLTNRKIYLARRPRTIQAYYTALHELGHFRVPSKIARLEQEKRAWKWAEKYALVKPDSVTRTRIKDCLASYSLK